MTGSSSPALPGACYAKGMTGFLSARQIRIFDYPQFAEPLRDRVHQRAAELASAAGITIEHIAKNHIRKEDVVARVLVVRGDRPGLVHIISAMIPIPKEELRVGKRQVQSAKACRVSTTVVEVPVEEQVKLRAETVVIERRPTKGTTVRGGESFQDHTIEVHEMYEEPVIGKVITQAEEMVIYKTLSERTATVRETVRQTEVNVDGQAKIQVRPPLEIAGENSLKVEESPKAPIQSQVETARETSPKVEETPKVSVPPQVETARDSGVKVEEQKKAQVHPQAKVGVAVDEVVRTELAGERLFVATAYDRDGADAELVLSHSMSEVRI